MKAYFGKGFRLSALPKREEIEKVDKKEVLNSLKKASETAQKKAYSKGKHSFKILALIDPAEVQVASPWAKRLVETLSELADTLP